MKVVSSVEMSVSIYQPIRHNVPEDLNLQMWKFMLSAAKRKTTEQVIAFKYYLATERINSVGL
jgi:hypothetical protein